VISIVQSYGSTDTGRKRRRNEDAFVCEPPLFAVADGMGGAQAGEVASGLAAAALRESGANGFGERRIAQLIQEANRRVHDRAITDATASGMGTTITAALVEPDGRVAFGHVGDSRAYLLRDGHLDQLTDDHSLVAELVRRGELSPQEAEVHPQRSVITRALGTDPDVDVDTFSIDARSGDVFLICSDGLSSYVDGTEIEELIARNRFDLESAAKALIQAANRGGGDDNITAVLFALAGAGEPDERTREYANKPDAPPEPDDEDTLHPEDHVTLPPELLDDDTTKHPAVDDTIIAKLPEPLAQAAPEPAPVEDAPAPVDAPPEAGLGRRVLASAVIVVLVVLIVVLTWWGLAR
jgi:serine/threonine protein phosphatase PrpC